MKTYTIAIAGTTQRTLQCAETLHASDHFDVSWVLTPSAKPVGRKKIITPNPMEQFAKENSIPAVFVEKKITKETQTQIEKLPKPDLLLVVDFGYIVPSWLLNHSKIAPLNIHPSELPRWRGSSPGQFALLFNEQKSAVTLMVIDEKLDHGPIIHQDFFTVLPEWTQTEYYEHAFDLMCTNLNEKIAHFAELYSVPEKRNTAATQQPDSSPTITARMIKKTDSFIPWQYIQSAMSGETPQNTDDLPSLLQTALKSNSSLPLTIERATKAFNPWPLVWTTVKTNQGEKRMKILEATVTKDTQSKLILKKVHIEGKNSALWNEVKNSVL